jgi:hypothetical protein
MIRQELNFEASYLYYQVMFRQYQEDLISLITKQKKQKKKHWKAKIGFFKKSQQKKIFRDLQIFMSTLPSIVSPSFKLLLKIKKRKRKKFYNYTSMIVYETLFQILVFCAFYRWLIGFFYYGIYKKKSGNLLPSRIRLIPINFLIFYEPTEVSVFGQFKNLLNDLPTTVLLK